MPKNDIELIPAVDGADYVVGDLHGNLTVAKALIEEKLQSNGRIIFAGDLVDRGEQSAELLSYLLDMHEKYPDSVKLIRGNHEEMLIDYVKSKDILISVYKECDRELKNNKVISNETGNKLITAYEMLARNRMSCLYNGGEWMLELEGSTRGVDEEIDFLREHLALVNSFRDTLSEKSKAACIHQANQWNDTILNYKSEGAKTLLSYAKRLNKLPYILCSQDKDGKADFLVVHASIPISDQELQKRIQAENFALSSDEKYYATWARMERFVSSKNSSTPVIRDAIRGPDSTVAIVGHQPFRGVDAAHNEVGVDTGISQTGIASLVNMKTRTAEVFYAKKSQPDLKEDVVEYIKQLCSEQSAHLQMDYKKKLRSIPLPPLPVKENQSKENQILELLDTWVLIVNLLRKSSVTNENIGKDKVQAWMTQINRFENQIDEVDQDMLLDSLQKAVNKFIDDVEMMQNVGNSSNKIKPHIDKLYNSIASDLPSQVRNRSNAITTSSTQHVYSKIGKPLTDLTNHKDMIDHVGDLSAGKVIKEVSSTLINEKIVKIDDDLVKPQSIKIKR